MVFVKKCYGQKVTTKNYFVMLIIIIIVGFIERKIDTNPLMCLSPRGESPGTGMG